MKCPTTCCSSLVLRYPKRDRPHSDGPVSQDLGQFENLGMRKTRFKSYRSLSFANHQNSGNPPVFLPTTSGHNILARANLRFLPPLIAVGDRDMSSLPEC